MADEQSLSIYYTGAVKPGDIDARELIQILSAFTRITTKASRTYHGSSTRSSIRIDRVQPGSIDLHWIHEVVASAQSTFPAMPALILGVKDVAALVKAWLDLLKFLKRQPPQKVQSVSNGTALQIENVSGQSTVIKRERVQYVHFEQHRQRRPKA
jgi:hypothetical protein